MEGLSQGCGCRGTRVPSARHGHSASRASHLGHADSTQLVRSEKGAAFVTVLLAVSLLFIVSAACLTMATVSARAMVWSEERTKARLAAEAGVNRWLFEAYTELAGSGDGRHAMGGNGRGHSHRANGGAMGQGKGSGGKGGKDEGDIGDLEVRGEINGISYVAGVESSPSEDSYRVVSVAQARTRRVTVAVTVGMVPEAWRHVVYADDPWYSAILKWFLMANDPSQYQPASGANEEIWLPSKDTGFVPIPNWGGGGADGYRVRVAPSWSPPHHETAVEVPPNGIVTLGGEGPFYIKDCEKRIRELRTSVNGDLYIEDCWIDRISGHVGGNLVVRNTGKAKGVAAVTGQIDGSVCIDSSEASPSGGWPAATTVGDVASPTTVAGSVYLRGRSPGILRDFLVVAGPDDDDDGTTFIGGGVFAEESCLYVKGNVTIRRVQAFPAVLAAGFVVLDGASGDINVDGPVYSEGRHAFSVLDVDPDIPGELDDWLGDKGLGVLMLGDRLRGGQPASVLVQGNVVTPGTTLLVGNVLVSYDTGLMLNPPPLFVGGKRLAAPIAGTWSSSHELVAGHGF